MTTDIAASVSTEQASEKVARFRELFADAPEVANTAVENVIDELTSQVATAPPASRSVSAGRAGSRQGKVSELTVVETRKLKRDARALDEFLDQVGIQVRQ